MNDFPQPLRPRTAPPQLAKRPVSAATRTKRKALIPIPGHTLAVQLAWAENLGNTAPLLARIRRNPSAFALPGGTDWSTAEFRTVIFQKVRAINEEGSPLSLRNAEGVITPKMTRAAFLEVVADHAEAEPFAAPLDYKGKKDLTSRAGQDELLQRFAELRIQSVRFENTANERANELAAKSIVAFTGPREAIAARLSPMTTAVRARIAAHLNRDPHQVRLHDITWALDEGADRVRIDAVSLKLDPQPQGDSEKRVEAYRQVLPALTAEDSTDWDVCLDDGGIAHFRFRKPMELPRWVNYFDIAPKTREEARFDQVPVGIEADGSIALVDTMENAHHALGGQTGAGKTWHLRNFLTGLVAGGWQIIGIDVAKNLAGMGAFKPYSKAWMTEHDTVKAAIILNAVYREVLRRIDLMAEYDAEHWSELPASAGVHGLVIFIDEAAKLLKKVTIPTGIPNDAPEMVNARLRAYARSVIVEKLELIAAEARAGGVKLIMTTQVWKSDYIETNIRDLLGGVFMMVNPSKVPDRREMAFLMGADTESAMEAATRFRRGGGKGLGLMLGDDGTGVHAFRSAVIQKEEVQPYFESRGIDEATPLEILPEDSAVFDTIREEAAAASGQAFTVRPARDTSPTSAAPDTIVRIDRGETSFSLDDLEALADEPEASAAEVLDVPEQSATSIPFSDLGFADDDEFVIPELPDDF